MSFFNKEGYIEGLRKNLKVDNALGFEQMATTLTQIMDGVQETKYYELLGTPLTEYVPIEMSKGAFSTNLLQFQVQPTATNFKTGLVQPGNGINKDATVDIKVDAVTIKNHFWRKKYTVTNEIVNMAAVNNETFSYIEELEKARYLDYRLGIQDAVFLGVDKDGKGLLNQENITVNTSLLTDDLTKLSIAEMTKFAKEAINTYLVNNNTTVKPNRWLIPTSDAVALGAPFNPEFPIKTIREVLEEAFNKVTQNDFKIVDATYCDNAGASGTAARHVLYNCHPDSLTMYIPKPYTPHPLYPAGALDLVSDAEAQFTGVWVKRPKEMLYIDVTKSST